MDVSLSNLSQGEDSAQPTESSKLEFDFSWTKFSSFINVPGSSSNPLYSIGFKTMKSQLTFKHSDGTIFGTGYLPGVSIDTNCSIHGKEIKLRAQKRFSFRYEYVSNVFLEGEDGEGKGQMMTWVCDTGLKTWDYVCLDSRQMPVARFKANIWALKKVGWFDLLGQVAENEEMRDEVLITGITLFYLTTLRTASLPSFFGAVFAGPRKEVRGKNKLGDDGKED